MRERGSSGLLKAIDDVVVGIALNCLYADPDKDERIIAAYQAYNLGADISRVVDILDGKRRRGDQETIIEGDL